MANPITIVNATVQAAPNPNTLQQTGAFISQGATVLAPNSYQILTATSSLTPLLTGAKAISTILWNLGVATVTAASPHGFTVSDTVFLTIAGAVPAGYNGTYLCTITSPTAFTYSLPSNPGVETTPGVYTPEDVAELVAMNTTFWGMGSQVPVYVLELGPGNAADGVTALTAWITANPGVFYAYLVPRTWAYAASYLSFLASFEAPNSKTYFFTTMALDNYKSFVPQMKDVFGLIEAPQLSSYPTNALTGITWSNSTGVGQVTATTTSVHGVAVGSWFQIAGVSPAGYNGFFQAQPGTASNTLIYNLATNPGAETVLGSLVGNPTAANAIPSTEFSLASAFWLLLSTNASGTNRVTPFSFAFLFGVTPFPTTGQSALLTTLAAANVNYVGTGAEGGITTSILIYGRTFDGNVLNYWYSIDWLQIQADLFISNAVINGSNNPINPLWYNQEGIRTLQGVLATVVKNGISAGLILGSLQTTELDPSVFATNVANGLYFGQAVVNAVPFAIYTAQNPSDYPKGRYAGLAVAFSPQTGFQQIIVNITAVAF